VLDDAGLPLVFSYRDALAHGFSRHQITRRVSTGAWRRLGRGTYAVAAVVDALPAREQHLVAVLGLLARRPDSDVASHLSAAAVHGWPLPLDGAGPPTLTAPTASSPTRRRHGAVLQVATLAPPDHSTRSVAIAGQRLAFRCTRPDRTVADLLRHLPIADSVAIADQVLRRGDTTAAALARAVRQQETWPYATRARRAAQLLDPRRETWLESYSFCTLVQAGLPMPEPQVTVCDRFGRFAGRVDGWWDDVAVALEPDGRAKYLAGLGRLPADVDAAADAVSAHVRRALLRQNERQRRLEDLGVVVVRWGTNDVAARPRTVVARAGRARRAADRSAFTGQLLRPPPWNGAVAPAEPTSEA
jgi:hypothetical protein